MAVGTAALFLLLGFELRRLHALYSVRPGNPHGRKLIHKYSCELTWPELLKRELGISAEWARQAMAAAERSTARLPEIDVKELLNTPLDQLPDLRRAEIIGNVQRKLPVSTPRQLLLELGLITEGSRGGDTSWSRNGKKLSPEEEHKRWMEASRQRFFDVMSAFSEMPDEIWKASSIQDGLLEQAADDAAEFVKKARAWLRIPRCQRHAPTPEFLASLKT